MKDKEIQEKEEINLKLQNKKKVQKLKEKGITLIALVVTIIILLIVVSVSLTFAFSENGLIDKAQEAAYTTKYSAYLETLKLNFNNNITSSGEDMKQYITNIEDRDLNNFVIINSELYYIGSDDFEKSIAIKLGINTMLSNKNNVEDMQKIVDNVLKIEDKNNYVGTKLLNKEPQNAENWDIVIDYDEKNIEKARYGTGYYFLKKGEKYNINEKELTLKGDYIVDYENVKLIALSNNIKEWNVNSTVAVQGAVLNIDPTTFESFVDENGSLDSKKLDTVANIKQYGDVKYNKDNKALVFNESEENTNGEGGYLELDRTGVDFKNGFTFEMYANLSRLKYKNSINNSATGLGLFCRMKTLGETYTGSMRFGDSNVNTICRFSDIDGNFEGQTLYTVQGGGIRSPSCGYEENKDFYLTAVYIPYSSTPSHDDNWQKAVEKNNNQPADKLEYYIDGKLFGYTYYSSEGYKKGLSSWNTDDNHFFLGVSCWYSGNNLYYLKGSVYTTRLYTFSINADQVLENVTTTQKYRSSF